MISLPGLLGSRPLRPRATADCGWCSSATAAPAAERPDHLARELQAVIVKVPDLSANAEAGSIDILHRTRALGNS
jgi:hypothetical protein